MHFFVKHRRLLVSLILVIGLAGCLLAAAAPAEAAAPKWFRLVPECATLKGEPGKPPPVPSLVCALQTFGNLAMIILGLTGSLALLMFVYGGFLMVISGGSSEKVSQGKKVITNAVIGIFIIMCSGLLIQYGMDKLKLSSSYKAVGVHCSNDTTVSATSRSTFIQLPDGTLKCVRPGGCDDLSSYGMSCLDVEGAGKGKYCLPNLCPLPRNLMCCYTPPR